MHGFDCRPEQASFASRGIWASRAKCRVLCDTRIARLARFLIKCNESALRLQDFSNLAVEANGIFGGCVNQLGPFPCLVVELCLLHEVSGLHDGLKRVAEVMSEVSKMLCRFFPFCSVRFSKPLHHSLALRI